MFAVNSDLSLTGPFAVVVVVVVVVAVVAVVVVVVVVVFVVCCCYCCCCCFVRNPAGLYGLITGNPSCMKKAYI